MDTNIENQTNIEIEQRKKHYRVWKWILVVLSLILIASFFAPYISMRNDATALFKEMNLRIGEIGDLKLNPEEFEHVNLYNFTKFAQKQIELNSEYRGIFYAGLGFGTMGLLILLFSALGLTILSSIFSFLMFMINMAIVYGIWIDGRLFTFYRVNYGMILVNALSFILFVLAIFASVAKWRYKKYSKA